MFDTTYNQEGVFDYGVYSQGIRSTLYPNLPPGLLVSGDPGISGSIIKSNYHLFCRGWDWPSTRSATAR